MQLIQLMLDSAEPAMMVHVLMIDEGAALHRCRHRQLLLVGGLGRRRHIHGHADARRRHNAGSDDPAGSGGPCCRR